MLMKGSPLDPASPLTGIFIKGLLRICRWPETEVHDYASEENLSCLEIWNLMKLIEK